MSSIRSLALLLGASLCQAQLPDPNADTSAGPAVGLPSVVPALPELPNLPPFDDTNGEIFPVVPEDGNPDSDTPEVGEPPSIELPALGPPVVEVPPVVEDGEEDVPVESPVDQPLVEVPVVAEPEVGGGAGAGAGEVVVPGQGGIPEGASPGEQGAVLRPLPELQDPVGELLPLPTEAGDGESTASPFDPLPSDSVESFPSGVPDFLDPLSSGVPDLLEPIPSDDPGLLEPSPSGVPEILDPLPSGVPELLDPAQPVDSTVSASPAIPTDTITPPSGLPVSLS